MKYKPGDILVHIDCSSTVYLILKVYFEEKKYEAFTLNHVLKLWIGKKRYMYTNELKLYTLLQETKTK